MSDDQFDPDPERRLYRWCEGMPIPAWLSKNSYGECYLCHAKFSSGRKHNCRVCGQLICSKCSGKFHLPKQFCQKQIERAQAKGEQLQELQPVRVCYDCRDVCFRRARRHAGEKIIITPPTMIVPTRGRGHITIHPPRWDPSEFTKDCKKCRKHFKKKQKRFNCRTCGHVFDAECTSKIELPQGFWLKDKSGPRRVCDECRYLLVCGAVLNEEPAPMGPPPEQSAPPAPMERDTLTVMWEHDGRYIAEIQLPKKGSKLTLASMNEDLLERQPALADKEFVYLCRGQPVSKAHWDIFKTKHFSPVMYLRYLEHDQDVAEKMEKMRIQTRIMRHVALPGTSTVVIGKLGSAAAAAGSQRQLLSSQGQQSQQQQQQQQQQQAEDADNESESESDDDPPPPPSPSSSDDDGDDEDNNNGNVAEAAEVKKDEPAADADNKKQRKVVESAAQLSSASSATKAIAELRDTSRAVSHAVALYPYKKKGDKTHLVLKAGDVIKLKRCENDQWWYGAKPNGEKGWFPASYVRIKPKSKEQEAAEANGEAPPSFDEAHIISDGDGGKDKDKKGKSPSKTDLFKKRAAFFKNK